MPVLCVDLVLHSMGNVLLCLRKNEPAKGEWWIPGGRVLKGERMIDTVIRKGYEELGILIKVEKLIGIYDMFWPTIHTPSATYLVSSDDCERINIDSQHSGIRWVNNANDLDPAMKQVLLDSGVLKQKGGNYGIHTAI